MDVKWLQWFTTLSLRILDPGTLLFDMLTTATQWSVQLM
jgi:hypothetical protein